MDEQDSKKKSNIIMKWNKGILLPIVFLLASCALSRSSGARSIREIQPSEAVIYTYVGEVHGWSGWAGVMNEVGIENAKSGALEEAAELEANYIIWDRPTESMLGTSITGKAYSHKFFTKQPAKLNPVTPDTMSSGDSIASMNGGNSAVMPARGKALGNGFPGNSGINSRNLYLLLEGATLIGQDDERTFLGIIGDNYSDKSIFNKYGDYGSKYSSTSIWDAYGDFGGEYSDFSPFSQFAIHPPLLVMDGEVLGVLSLNKYLEGAISPYVILEGAQRQ